MNFSNTDLENLLKRHFDQDEFEPGQEEIVTSVISARDVLAVTRRGYDQSVCYKLPAMILEGLVLVVSRTGQLVEKEDSAFLPATHISNFLPSEHLQKRIWSMVQGEYKLIYAGAEQFRNRAFLFALSKISISLLVVESAHRVSRWGHDFRSDYLDISKAVTEMDSPPPILALAGACTQRTRDNICYQLEIDNAKRVTLDLALPNVSLEVRTALSHEEKFSILESLVRELSGAGIIYTNSRRQTVEVCEFLKEFEDRAAIYHAGLEREKRVKVEKAFKADQLHIVVATNSFSPGSGKATVRYVIHFDIPDRPERYYEQISAAGGDGQPARCILIYSPSDRGFHHSMIERNAVSSVEAWRIGDVLERYGQNSNGKSVIQVKDDAVQAPRNKALNGWLREHFEHLTVEAQKELNKLKDRYENLDARDKNPMPMDGYERYLEGDHWKAFSKKMLAEHKQCQICELKSKHVHHLHYRNLGRERVDDMMVLCAKCHCFIHPNNPMTKKMFEEICESEKKQFKLFEPPEPIRPPVVLPYGLIETEAAIDRYKLNAVLREMEMADMLTVIPDCSMQARVRILVSRNELASYAEDEIGQSLVEWLLENSKADPGGEVYVDFARLKNELSHPHDVLEDCFLTLHYAEAISYRPSRKSMALRLMNLNVSLTDDVFEKLKASRYQALRDMEKYANTKGCRQRFLRDYLGDEGWGNCGKCDNCVNEPSGAAIDLEMRNVRLPHYARIAMELVNRADGKLSRDALVGILAGVQQRTTRFDKWAEFGTLSMFAPEDILKVLDFLVGHGFLKEEGETHPPLDLTRKGFRALNGELELDDARSIVSLAEDMKRIAQVEQLQPAVSLEDQEAVSEQDRALLMILRCAERTNGQVGRSGLVKILRGEKSKKLSKYGFDHIEEYGSLPDMPKKAVLEQIDAMIERGCLVVTSFFFPMVRLTELGQKRLNKMPDRSFPRSDMIT